MIQKVIINVYKAQYNNYTEKLWRKLIKKI